MLERLGLESVQMRDLAIGFRREHEALRRLLQPGLDRLLGRDAVPDAVQFDGREARRIRAQEVGLFQPGRIEPSLALPWRVREAGETDEDVSSHQTAMPHKCFAARPMPYVSATAAARITRFVRMRRRMSIPERKASSIETRIMMVPAAITGRSASCAPSATGSSGTMAPMK